MAAESFKAVLWICSRLITVLQLQVTFWWRPLALGMRPTGGDRAIGRPRRCHRVERASVPRCSQRTLSNMPWRTSRSCARPMRSAVWPAIAIADEGAGRGTGAGRVGARLASKACSGEGCGAGSLRASMRCLAQVWPASERRASCAGMLSQPAVPAHAAAWQLFDLECASRLCDDLQPQPQQLNRPRPLEHGGCPQHERGIQARGDGEQAGRLRTGQQ